MKSNQYGEIIFNAKDCFNLLMQGHSLDTINRLLLDNSVNIQCDLFEQKLTPQRIIEKTCSVTDYDLQNQNNWYMPDEYKNLDIAEYVLSLCTTDQQLQRVGQELLLYQKKNLFNLLRYLKYLVDTMRENNIIWGVGRGSSVASYVLYLLGVHKIDSIYYDLGPEEFLR